MFLAGAVCLTALSMMHRDIVSAERSAVMREQFGPFEPCFFYGIVVVEIVMITAFGYAVIKSIIHRKQLENHAWWLISTVFIIMMPALARGVGNVQIAMQLDQWPDINNNYGVYIAEGIILAVLFLGAWKYGKLKHPATWLAAVVNLFNLFVEPIGKSEAVQSFLNALIRG